MKFGGIPDPAVTAARLRKRRRRRKEPGDYPPGTVAAREPGKPKHGDDELASRIGVEVYDSTKGHL